MPDQEVLTKDNVEQILAERYDTVVTEALKQNDPQKVLNLKWGRLFLAQTYGYTLD
jgi:hypothetical protein